MGMGVVVSVPVKSTGSKASMGVNMKLCPSNAPFHPKLGDA